jgi:hypothetical protein
MDSSGQERLKQSTFCDEIHTIAWRRASSRSSAIAHCKLTTNLAYGRSSGRYVSSASANTVRLKAIDPRFDGWTNQPTVRTPPRSISESSDSVSTRAMSDRWWSALDGDDHEIAVLGQWSEAFVLDAVVRGYRDDFAVIIRDDDLTIERRLFDVVTPADETRDDLSHFVEPWRPNVAEVE